MSVLDDTAARVLFDISRLPDSEIGEYLSVIYEDPVTGALAWADPMNIARAEARGPRKDTKARASWYIPLGSARALVHNHPGESKKGRGFHNFFSAEDVEQAKRLGVPSYIGTDAGEIRKFDPSKPAWLIKSGNAVTKGEPVLAQYPWEEHKRRLMQSFFESMRK